MTSTTFTTSGRNTTTMASAAATAPAVAVQGVVDVAAAYIIKRLLLPVCSHILSDLPAPPAQPARHLRREEASLPEKQQEEQQGQRHGEAAAARWEQCLRGASIFGENRSGGGAASAMSAAPDVTPSSLKDAASYLTVLGDCESAAAAAVVVDIVSATLLLAGRHLIHTLNHQHSPLPPSSSSSPFPPAAEEPTTASTMAAPAEASTAPSVRSTWLCLPPLPTTIQDDCPQDCPQEDETEPLSSWRSRLRSQTAHSSLLSAVDASLTTSVAQFPARFFGIHWELPIGRGDGAVHGVDFFSLSSATCSVVAAGDEKGATAPTGCPTGHAGFVKRSQLRKSKNLCKALFLRYTYATTSTPEGLLGELLWNGKGRSTAKHQTSEKTEEQPTVTLSRSPPKSGGGCDNSNSGSSHGPQQQHRMAVIGGAGAAPSGRLIFWPCRRNAQVGDTTAQATTAATSGVGDTPVQGANGTNSANSSPCKDHHHKHHNNVHHQFHHHTHQRTRTTGRDPFYREPVVIGTSVAMNDVNEDVAATAAVSGGDATAGHLISSMHALAQDVSGYGALVNVLGCDCAANASMQSVGSGPWHLASIDDGDDDEYLQEGDSHHQHNADEDEHDDMEEEGTAVVKNGTPRLWSPPARLGHYLDADTLVPADSPAALLFPSCRVVRSAPAKRAGAATNSRTEFGVVTGGGGGLALLVGAEAAGVGGGDGTEDGFNTATNVREHAFPVVCFASTPPPQHAQPCCRDPRPAASDTGARRPPPAITLSLQMLFPSLTVLSMPSSLLHSWSALVFGILQPLTSLTTLNVSGNTLCNDIPLTEMVRVCFENNHASNHCQNQNEASTPSAKQSPGKSSTNGINGNNNGSVPHLLPRLTSLTISESTTSSETLLFLLATFSVSLTELNAGFLKAPSQMGHYYRNVLMNGNVNDTGRGNRDKDRNKISIPATILLDACIDHYAAPLHPYRIALAISRYQLTEDASSMAPTAPSSQSSVCSPPPLSPLESFFVCAAQGLLQKLQKLTVDGTDFSVPLSLQDAYHRHRTRGTENKEKYNNAAKTDLSSLLRGASSSSSPINNVPMTEPSVGVLFSSILCVATAADKALHQWRRRLLPQLPTPPHCRSTTCGNPHAIIAPRLHSHHHNTPTMQEHASAQQQQDADRLVRVAAIPPNLPQGVALPSPMPSFAIAALPARPPLPLTLSYSTTVPLSTVPMVPAIDTTTSAAAARASSSLSVSGALHAKPSLRCVSVSSCPTLVSLAYPTATPVKSASNECSAKRATACDQQDACDEEDQFERHFFLEDTRARLDAELDVLRRAAAELFVGSDADIGDADASLYHLCYFFRSVGVRVFDHVTLLQARGTAIDDWDKGLLDLHDRRCPSSSYTHPSTNQQQEEDASVQTKPCFPRLQEILFSDCPALGSHKSSTSSNATTTGAPEHDIFTVNNIMNDISTQRRLLVGLLPPRIVKLNKSDVTRSEISCAERFLQQRLGYAAPYAERVVRPLQVTFSKSWIMQTAKRATCTTTTDKKKEKKLHIQICGGNADDSDAAEAQRLSFLFELLGVFLQIRPVEQHSHHGSDATTAAASSDMTAASSLAGPTMADYLVDVFGIGLVPGPFLPLPPAHASTSSNTTSSTITVAATTPKATDERQALAKNIKGVAALYVHHPHHKPRHGQHNHYFDLASSTVLAAEREGHAIDLRPGGCQNPLRPPTPPPSVQQPSADGYAEGGEEKATLQDEAALYDEMKTIRQPSDDDVDEDAVDRGGKEADDQQDEETAAAGPQSPSKYLLPTTTTARSPPKAQQVAMCGSTAHASQATQPQQPQQQIIFPLVAAPRLRKALIESVVVEAAKAHADLVFAAARLCVLYSPFVASCAAYVQGRTTTSQKTSNNHDEDQPPPQTTLDEAVADIMALGQQHQPQSSSHCHRALSIRVDSTIVEASAKLAHDIAKYVRLFAYCNENDGVQAVLLEQLQQEQEVTVAKTTSAVAATTSLTNAQTPFPVIAGTFTKVFVRHMEQHCGLFAEVANADILRPADPCSATVDAAANADDGAGENCVEEGAAAATTTTAAALAVPPLLRTSTQQSSSKNNNSTTTNASSGAAVIMLHKRVKTIEALARNRELHGYETISELQALLRRAATAPDPCRVALGGDGARFIGRSPAAVDFLLEHGFIRESGTVTPATTGVTGTGGTAPAAGWGSASPSPAAASPSPTMPRYSDEAEAADGPAGAMQAGSLPMTPTTPTTIRNAKNAAVASARVDYVYIPVVPLEDSVDWHVFRSEMLEALALLQWALTCNTSLITVRLHRLTFFGTHAVSSTSNRNTPPSAAMSPASSSASPSAHATASHATTSNTNTVPFLEGGGDYRFEVTLLWRDELDCIREQTLNSEYFDLNDALAITDGTGIPAALAGGSGGANRAPPAAMTVRPSPGVSPSSAAGATLPSSQTPHMHAVTFTRKMAVLPSSECDKACTITVAVRRRKPKGALASFFSSSTSNSGTITAASPPLPFSNTECARMAVDLRAPDKSGRCGLPIGRVAIEIDSLQLRFMDAENEILKFSQRAAAAAAVAESASQRQRDAAVIIAAPSSSEARHLSSSRRGSVASA